MKRFWGFLIVFIIILAYIIPYTILSELHSWQGSFLFWTITGIVIIIANVMATRDWSE
ncbi:hypothetical protein [Ornithinibacillus scapharcae]|uniref:hypothetical protein n=1 Tax=Ornithinibacillus scapharcae TaxID=1147159 RepID=UPI000225BA7C|nr:hypothetical protein [Ornithinibacillus scapharcae]